MTLSRKGCLISLNDVSSLPHVSARLLSGRKMCDVKEFVQSKFSSPSLIYSSKNMFVFQNRDLCIRRTAGSDDSVRKLAGFHNKSSEIMRFNAVTVTCKQTICTVNTVGDNM